MYVCATIAVKENIMILIGNKVGKEHREVRERRENYLISIKTHTSALTRACLHT